MPGAVGWLPTCKPYTMILLLITCQLSGHSYPNIPQATVASSIPQLSSHTGLPFRNTFPSLLLDPPFSSSLAELPLSADAVMSGDASMNPKVFYMTLKIYSSPSRSRRFSICHAIPLHLTPAPSEPPQLSFVLCRQSNKDDSLPRHCTSSRMKVEGTLPNFDFVVGEPVLYLLIRTLKKLEP